MLKLSDLTAENIRNTKIHVKNEGESKAFQERAFELGVRWTNPYDAQKPSYLNEPYLFVKDYGNLLLTHSNGEEVFRTHPHDEIKVDFSNKPSWEDAPEWAQWLAQDKSGCWFWHESKPMAAKDRQWDSAETFGGFNKGIPNPNWRDTLEQRPQLPEWRKFRATAEMPEQTVAAQVDDSHYQQFKIQPINFIQQNNLDFMTGNVIKYVCRAPYKNSKGDLLKARDYLDRMINEYENN